MVFKAGGGNVEALFGFSKVLFKNDRKRFSKLMGSVAIKRGKSYFSQKANCAANLIPFRMLSIYIPATQHLQTTKN